MGINFEVMNGMVKKSIRNILAFALVAVFLLAFSACAKSGNAVDPGSWGYDCMVTYDALGGMVNAREIRKTYYMPNSYVFRPSGSSNMLVEPARDGYVLAGWYTAKADAAADSAEEYAFSASDRWDFNTDRVQEDMTLYARWLPRGKVDYVNADTNEILFSKNITTDSPIQALSDSIMDLKTPAGVSFDGYYADAACTQPYDFSSYEHVDPNPTEAQLYATLCEMFPQYLAAKEYVEPEEDDSDDEAELGDTSWLFLNKLGYELLTDDPAAIAEIDAAKDELMETAITAYLTNTAGRIVYLKFMDGNYVRVRTAQDLKRGTEYGFFDTDLSGSPIDGYSLEADIDLTGVTFVMSDSFSGTVKGNGYTLRNLTVASKAKKADKDTEKFLGLAMTMEGATFNDLTIENAALTIQLRPGVKVTGGLFAASAKNVTFNNCTFRGLSVDTGTGDDGKASYALGDLFGSFTDCTFNNCSADELTVVSARSPEAFKLALFKLAEPEPEPEGEETEGNTP